MISASIIWHSIVAYRLAIESDFLIIHYGYRHNMYIHYG